MIKKTKIEEDNARLKKELSKAKKANEKLSQQLERSKSKTGHLKKELKKNDVRKVVLTEEQEQLLSNLSQDIDIRNLLSD